MASKTSFFNKTLLGKNLARFWPLWGMASFVGALFPLALALQLLRHGWDGTTALDFTDAYYSVVVYALPILSLLYAALCAMVVWSYLYNARSVGLMHTLPIRRESLFVTGFLSGMAMMLIPYIITGALCIVISLAAGFFDPTGLLVTVLAVLGESFFYFASATFAAFVTGNLFALPVIYLLLHFLSVLLDWLVSTLAQGFLFGFNSSYSGVAEWLSPTVYLENRVQIDRTYTETLVQQPGEPSWYRSVLTDIRLDGIWLVGVYVLVGVVLLGLAYVLYRRRRSESAGDVVAAPWLRPVFRYGVSALSALIGGIALYEIFWASFQNGRWYAPAPMAVCMSVAGIIGYYAASMLLAKSLRVFHSGWKGTVLVAAVCALACCMLQLDVLGISDRIPAAADTERVELYTAGNHYIFYTGEDDEVLKALRQVHGAIVADRDYIMNTDTDLSTAELTAKGISPYNTVQLTYYLKSGLEVNRWYQLLMTKERLAQPDTYDYLLDRLVNGEALKARRLHLDDSRYVPDGGSVYVNARSYNYDLNSRETAAILEGVGKDIAAGVWGHYDWFASNDSDAYAVDVSLSFKGPEKNSRDWVTVVLRPGMIETIGCLKDLGLITDRDLVTNQQMYPENYELMNEKYGVSQDQIVFDGAEQATEIVAEVS